MLTLPIIEQAREQEWNKILTIAQNNGFPKHTVYNPEKKLTSKQKKKPLLKDEQQTTQKEDKKWITFTYYSPLVRKVTNPLKKTDIIIAFRYTNTIHQQLSQKPDNTNPSGIYKIKCNTCNKAYIGQSGRLITVRHKEHTLYIRTNNLASVYAIHILNNRHKYGMANDTLKLLQLCNKGMKMNCW